ncbi:MAG: hypothetical protein JWO15_438 [Sphingomonadales bacterium]|nr:hypothetical protein [Sphingomonadales bacterium]
MTAPLRLLRPRYPSVAGTAGYFYLQATHRRHAIELALGAIAALPGEPAGGFLDLDDVIRDWASDTLIQGACLREYHHWEADTKHYFAAAYQRHGQSLPSWKGPGSHVVKVSEQLDTFQVALPSSLQILDAMRGNLNNLKHESEYLVTMADLDLLTQAVYAFWGDIGAHEIFVP